MKTSFTVTLAMLGGGPFGAQAVQSLHAAWTEDAGRRI